MWIVSLKRKNVPITEILSQIKSLENVNQCPEFCLTFSIQRKCAPIRRIFLVIKNEIKLKIPMSWPGPK